LRPAGAGCSVRDSFLVTGENGIPVSNAHNAMPSTMRVRGTPMRRVVRDSAGRVSEAGGTAVVVTGTAAGAATAAPHRGQNFAPAGTGALQFAQNSSMPHRDAENVPLPLQALDELDLSCVIQDMRGDAVDQTPLLRVLENARRHPLDRRAKLTMLVIENPDDVAPTLLVDAVRREPVASFPNERPRLLSRQPASGSVLPVSTMQRQLPDVVPVFPRPPGHLLDGKSTQCAAQSRAVPALAIVRSIEIFE